jgi:anti-sigma regulatory factor (Ser/Thr protein kinase)
MTVRHDALVFDNDAELVLGTHDLIEQGLLDGDVVLVLEKDPETGVLRSAWDDDPRISFVEQAEFYDSPMRTMARFQRMLDGEAVSGHRLRATGPVPFGDAPRARRGWMRYEALVDRALAPYDVLALCQYDTRVVGADLVDLARATHARVVSASGAQAGGRGRAQVLAAVAESDGPDLLESQPVVYEDELVRVGELFRLRAGMSAAPHDLALAVNEVVTNAFEHGAPPVVVRLHQGADSWLCVVIDHGPGLPDPYAGIDSPLPGNPAPHGYGLWLARQLCDFLTIARHPGPGTTVRLELRAARPGPGPATG